MSYPIVSYHINLHIILYPHVPNITPTRSQYVPMLATYFHLWTAIVKAQNYRTGSPHEIPFGPRRTALHNDLHLRLLPAGWLFCSLTVPGVVPWQRGGDHQSHAVEDRPGMTFFPKGFVVWWVVWRCVILNHWRDDTPDWYVKSNVFSPITRGSFQHLMMIDDQQNSFGCFRSNFIQFLLVKNRFGADPAWPEAYSWTTNFAPTGQ